MALSSSSPRRRWIVGGSVLVVVAVVAALFVALRGGGDGLRGVRSQDVIAAAERTGSTIDLDLRRGADRAAVLAALDELPEDARWVNLKLGRVDADVDRATGETRAALVDLMLAAAAVRAPVVSIEISRRSGIDMRVAERAQAGPLVLEFAELIPREGAPGVERNVRVQQVGSSPPGQSILSLELQAGQGTETALAVVRAAQTLGDREPRVSGRSSETELRVQADSLEDAADAWREASRAVSRSGAAGDTVELYVDRRRSDGVPTSPMVSGPTDQDADRALALIRRLERAGTDAFATTDLGFARVAVDDAASARGATEAAEVADVGRFQTSWTSTSSDTAWMALTAGRARMQTSVDDEPRVALQVLTGASKARAAGIRALHWDRQAVDGVPRLRLALPTWLPVGTDLVENETQLRRFFRAVRAIGWPGTARFDVSVGRGTCTNSASAVVRITSTSSGSARRVESGSSCTDQAALGPIRQAWNASSGS